MAKILLFLFAILVGIVLYQSRIREHFGGPVKHMRNIPKTSCWKICDQYYADCMSKYAGVDAGFCMNRLQSCKNVCNHSNFMVL